MSDAVQKTLDDIDRFGCSVMHVLEEDDLPPFSYSVGIARTSSAPEIVVIGLRQPIAHFIVNEYNRRVRAGEVFRLGERYAGFLEGFEVAFKKVDVDFYEEYFGQCLGLYEGPTFDVVQLVYPDTDGHWPWQPEATDWFRARQPILTSQPPTTR